MALLSSALGGCSGDDAEPAEDPAAGSADGDGSVADLAELAREAALNAPAGPTYTASGELVRRDDWPSWVFLGASLNLTYDEEPRPVDVFANVFMEPSAYAHFAATGEFPEGTQTAVVVYRATGEAAPAEGGRYAGEQVVFEMSVKDSALDPEVPWRYYSFGDGASAPANPRQACFDCHAEHAATDHVFTQFYPVLREQAASPAPP